MYEHKVTQSKLHQPSVPSCGLANEKYIGPNNGLAIPFAIRLIPDECPIHSCNELKLPKKLEQPFHDGTSDKDAWIPQGSDRPFHYQ